MKFIAHRGNTNGIQKEKENSIDYINNALDQKFDVEIDVYFYKNNFWLGHDEPEFKINNLKLLNSNQVWIHAKNIEAAFKLVNMKSVKFFWHQNDDMTLTSNNFIWTYPNKKLSKNSICVLPEIQKNLKIKDLKNIYGICSDYVDYYRKKLVK